MWSRNVLAVKRAESIFAALRKKWPTKTILEQNKINMEELLILEF